MLSTFLKNFEPREEINFAYNVSADCLKFRQVTPQRPKCLRNTDNREPSLSSDSLGLAGPRFI